MLALRLPAGGLGLGGGRVRGGAPGFGFVDRRHQAPLSGLGLPQFVLQPLGGRRQAVAPLLQRLQTCFEARHLSLAQVDAGA